MCFNHLINRAIPHVGKNDLNSSNAITSTVFFSRYPKLREYLLQLTREVFKSSDVLFSLLNQTVEASPKFVSCVAIDFQTQTSFEKEFRRELFY
jgi:hypothetical protein